MITSITRANHARIAALLVAELEQFGKTHGVTITAAPGGRLANGERSGTFYLDMAVNGPAGQTQTAGELRFKDIASFKGFAPTDLKREFLFRGDRYRLVGLSPSRPKYDCDVERVSDGKLFKMRSQEVKAGFVAAPTTKAA